MKSGDKLQYEIDLLDTICRGLQTTLSVEKIVHIILTGLTAGTSLGFSRAAIFFIEEGVLKDGRGIGPYDPDEAGKIWAELTNLQVSLDQMFENSHRMTLESQRFPIEIRSITCEIIKLDNENPLKRAISSGEIIVLKGDEKFLLPREFHWFVRQSSDIVIGPVKISGRIGAVVFADNAFHNRTISQETLKFLSIILSQAGLALSNAFAYESIEQNLKRVQNLNEELRQMQEELLACERLAAAGRISAYLAHEIRNPLAIIGGFAQQILEIQKEKKDIDVRIIRNARIIVSEVRRLELVLNNLLRFSFNQPAKKQRIHLKSFVNELIEVLSINIEYNRIKLSIEIPEDIYINADRVQLSEVFYNLIHNSLESIKPGGSITIKAGEDEHNVWVEISDTGCGIPQDVMKDLFKQFFTTKSHGMGLGLYLVKNIIEENHSGKIEISSEVGVGTKVYFTIPKKEEYGEKNTGDRRRNQSGNLNL
ncbi:MAG TPA: ATP-binding protein [Candidatus Ratteibacteria bacterium]|jgi:hypothetical protein|uniref:histidine kinase n=1 Tax=candidate division TA06 bacterium ADurb.Bin131 TaxID=1852827 RepID=A0A1V6CAN8_UNCT6|nr:MAG: Sporulation kinase A [candidate division TA06 bacterium ADurb.Bin131]HON05390.1 ATP-binding protein [bacterium]HRS06200.1 ATP-binding protein [Candidatus Ratteibacteria bacterium]HOQ82517.1 ATP-binding protein [bacterium]HPC29035.1 ATP-binding protein [bacterium]